MGRLTIVTAATVNLLMQTRTVSIPVTGKLLLAFIVVPLVELALLMQLYTRTNLLTTILIVVSTGMLGVYLARRQGLKVWKEIHQQLASGSNPSAGIMNGVMILFAGALLMTPGILTDCLGFSLLVPWVRTRLRRRLTVWFRDRTLQQFGGRWSSDPFTDAPVEAPNGERPSVRVVDPASKSPSSSPVTET